MSSEYELLTTPERDKRPTTYSSTTNTIDLPRTFPGADDGEENSLFKDSGGEQVSPLLGSGARNVGGEITEKLLSSPLQRSSYNAYLNGGGSPDAVRKHHGLNPMNINSDDSSVGGGSYSFRDSSSCPALSDLYWSGRPLLFRFNPCDAFPHLRLYTEKNSAASMKATVRRSMPVVVTQKHGSWWYIACSGFEGWAHVEEQDMHAQRGRKPVMEQIDEVRRCEDWQGNNMFFLGGRAMVGSDGKLLLFTNAFMLFPALLFFGWVLPELNFYNSLFGMGSEEPPEGHEPFAAEAYPSVVSLCMYVDLWVHAWILQHFSPEMQYGGDM